MKLIEDRLNEDLQGAGDFFGRVAILSFTHFRYVDKECPVVVFPQ